VVTPPHSDPLPASGARELTFDIATIQPHLIRR
jgi:hypothetical protein